MFLYIKGVIVFCWIFVFVVNLLMLIVFVYDEKSDFCMENWLSWVFLKVYVMVIFFLGLSLVVVMYVLYF